MPATALPANGNQPESHGVKTCDASGMAEIHRMYRAGFAEGPTLVKGVRDGDLAHAQVVADNLALLSISLHAHHEGEDLKLWDTITERAPSCAIHVGRMKEQHAKMLVHLNALDPALEQWRTTASATDAAAVLDALDGVNAALDVHLGDEETNIVPVMETTLTESEVEWFAQHGRASTPKGQAWYGLGAMLAAQPDGGTEWLRKNMPAPARLLWRWVGKPKYEARRAALVGK